MRFGRAVGGFVFLLGAVSPAMAQRARVAMDPSPIGNPGGWISPDDYPKEAIGAGRQGRVVVAIDVDVAGRAVGCKIALSSGTESLDSKACEIVLERGRFNPATDRRGRTIRGSYNLPIRWVLPDSDGMGVFDLASIPADETLEMEIGVDRDGQIASCRVVTRAESMKSDPCQRFVVGKPWGRHYIKDGQPIAITLHQRFSQSIRPASAP